MNPQDGVFESINSLSVERTTLTPERLFTCFYYTRRFKIMFDVIHSDLVEVVVGAPPSSIGSCFLEFSTDPGSSHKDLRPTCMVVTYDFSHGSHKDVRP